MSTAYCRRHTRRRIAAALDAGYEEDPAGMVEWAIATLVELALHGSRPAIRREALEDLVSRGLLAPPR